MKSFQYYSPTEIMYGAGSLAQLPDQVRALGMHTVLLVCDGGLIKAGMLDKVTPVLQQAGIPFHVFSDIEPDPEVRSVEDGLAMAREKQCDGIVALGGGSVMDTAKAIAVMLTNPGSIRDYFGIDKIVQAGRPVIAIPTTAGTGSEVTVWSVLSDTQNQRKEVIGSYLNCARVALLDPELTLTLPAGMTAATGMDALTHAIESYTNKLCHVFAESAAEKATALIAQHLRVAVAQGDNLEARGNMLLASSLAGLAFNRIRLGLAHAFALPLGNRFHIPHGLANAIMLTPVMQFNLPGNLQAYANIARLFGEPLDGLSQRDAAERSVHAVRRLKQDIGITHTLADFGVQESHFDDIIDETLLSGNVVVNPRMPTRNDLRHMLQQALAGEV